MRIAQLCLRAFCLLIVTISLSGCIRSSDEVWEDSKSARRHVTRGFRTLGGKHGSSRAVQCRDDFMPCYDESYDFQEEFVPLEDQPGMGALSMGNAIQQPRETPGDPGSSIPGIGAFYDPSTNPSTARIFRNVQFEYNSNLVKGQNNVNTIKDIAEHMKRNPNMYVFVEGHCDERGPEAFNLALGSRRSNAVRNMLIQEGVHPDHVFTISYGKERPLMHEQNEEAWSQNRRAEFKVYSR